VVLQANRTEKTFRSVGAKRSNMLSPNLLDQLDAAHGVCHQSAVIVPECDRFCGCRSILVSNSTWIMLLCAVDHAPRQDACDSLRTSGSSSSPAASIRWDVTIGILICLFGITSTFPSDSFFIEGQGQYNDRMSRATGQ
jgi:hypothetical protein